MTERLLDAIETLQARIIAHEAAMRQALEALWSATGYMSDQTRAGKEVAAAITALREALGEQG